MARTHCNVVRDLNTRLEHSKKHARNPTRLDVYVINEYESKKRVLPSEFLGVVGSKEQKKSQPLVLSMSRDLLTANLILLRLSGKKQKIGRARRKILFYVKK